jgi:hypothetical protein
MWRDFTTTEADSIVLMLRVFVMTARGISMPGGFTGSISVMSGQKRLAIQAEALSAAEPDGCVRSKARRGGMTDKLARSRVAWSGSMNVNTEKNRCHDHV